MRNPCFYAKDASKQWLVAVFFQKGCENLFFGDQCSEINIYAKFSEFYL